MRALVKTTDGPGLELTDVPEPICGDHDVKIRVLPPDEPGGVPPSP